MRKYLICVIFLLSGWLTVFGNDSTYQSLKLQRLNHIHPWHVGIGGNVGAFAQNCAINPCLSVGYGSWRQWGSIDISLGYECTMPWRFGTKPYLVTHHLPISVTASLHYYRWKENCLYFGGEYAYHFALGGDYTMQNGSTYSISQSVQDFSSVDGKLGIRFRHCDLSVFYLYRLAPAWNQRYIYESKTFDYNLLHDAIFERMMVGLSFIYLFEF